jgi:hypothetical protein
VLALLKSILQDSAQNVISKVSQVLGIRIDALAGKPRSRV